MGVERGCRAWRPWRAPLSGWLPRAGAFRAARPPHCPPHTHLAEYWDPRNAKQRGPARRVRGAVDLR